MAAVSPVMMGWMYDPELNMRVRHGLERMAWVAEGLLLVLVVVLALWGRWVMKVKRDGS